MVGKHLSVGVRRFLREVGSVVLGVLIALGIGELADDLRWRSRAANSTQAMNLELARAAGVLDERAIVQPCLDRRLEELAAIVLKARRTGVLPDVGAIGRPPVRPLQTSAWDDAVASGTLPHLDPARRSALALNYPSLKDFPRDSANESASWSNLNILAGVPGPASELLLIEAAGIIARLQWGTAIMGLTAEQIRNDLIAQGIKPSYFLILDREGSRSEIIATGRANRVCHSLVTSLSNAR